MIVQSTHELYVEVRQKINGIRSKNLIQGTGLSKPTVYKLINKKPIRLRTLELVNLYILGMNSLPVYSLEKLRQYTGMSQSEVAIFLGISQSTLSRVEITGIVEDSKYYPYYLQLLKKVDNINFYAFLEKIPPKMLLKKIRQSLKLNQTQFSRAIGISQPFISQIENSTRRVSTYQVYEYAKKLKLSNEDLSKIITCQNLNNMQ